MPDPRSTIHLWAFYTLTGSVFVGPQIPEDKREGSPARMRYPMAHLGYMGRFNDDRLQGIGTALLYDAAARVVEGGKHVATWGMWLEPENQELESWYARWGFEHILADPSRPKQPGTRARMFCAAQPLIDAIDKAGGATFP